MNLKFVSWIVPLVAIVGLSMNRLSGRPMTVAEKWAKYGPIGGASTDPTEVDEDAAIAALQVTNADENTVVGLVLDSKAATEAKNTDLTNQLAAALANQEDLMTKLKARVVAIQQLNTDSTATTAKMRAALAAPVPPSTTAT